MASLSLLASVNSRKDLCSVWASLRMISDFPDSLLPERDPLRELRPIDRIYCRLPRDWRGMCEKLGKRMLVFREGFRLKGISEFMVIRSSSLIEKDWALCIQ